MSPTQQLARAALRLAAACQHSSCSATALSASPLHLATRNSSCKDLLLCRLPTLLPCSPPPTLHIARITTSNTTSISPVAASFSTSTECRQEQPPSQEDFSQCTTPGQVLALVEGRGEALGDADLTAALAALARCAREAGRREEVAGEVVSHSAFQALADMAAQGAARQAPAALASQVSSFGALGFGDELVLDALSQQLMVPGRLQELGAEELRQLVEGLAAADHSPSILLLDAVSERLHNLTTSASGGGAAAAAAGGGGDPAGNSGSSGSASGGGRDARDLAGGGRDSSSGGGQLEEHVGAIQARLRDLGHSGDVGDQGLGLAGQQASKDQPERAAPGGSDYA